MQEEVWKDIKGYEGLYKISNYGRLLSYVKSKTYPKILKPQFNDRFQQILHKNGKNVKISIHTQVAIAFIPNPNNYRYVKFKDKDKTNLYFENLEWWDTRKPVEILFKKCKRCGEVKSIVEFHKNHYNANKRTTNCKQCIKIINKEKRNNLEYVLYKRAYYKKEALKRRADAKYRMISAIRNRIQKICKLHKLGKKDQHFKNIIGITIDEFYNYIEQQFDDKMTWSNYGSYWHIDHIIPLVTAKNIQDVYTLNHYTNLRPLEAIENLRKGKMLPEDYNNVNN